MFNNHYFRISGIGNPAWEWQQQILDAYRIWGSRSSTRQYLHLLSGLYVFGVVNLQHLRFKDEGNTWYSDRAKGVLHHCNDSPQFY